MKFKDLIAKILNNIYKLKSKKLTNNYINKNSGFKQSNKHLDWFFKIIRCEHIINQGY